jgi:putative PIN family toxin of toxin-antitoxin system
VRIVLDTNVLISALITKGTPPQQLHCAWKDEKYALLTSDKQLEELSRSLTKPRLARYIDSESATLLLLELHEQAEILFDLPTVLLSPDPDDNYILAIAIGGEADYLVTGDKRDLLSLVDVQGIPIITPRLALQKLA